MKERNHQITTGGPWVIRYLCGGIWDSGTARTYC